MFDRRAVPDLLWFKIGCHRLSRTNMSMRRSYRHPRTSPTCLSATLNKLLNRCYDMNPYDYISVDLRCVGLRTEHKVKFSAMKNLKRRTERNFFTRVIGYANFLIDHSDINVYSSPDAFRRQLKSYLHELTASSYSSNSNTWFFF